MPSVAVKRRLAQDVGLWQTDGLVPEATARLLAERYATPGFGIITIVKYLGIAGGLLAGFGVMGLVAAAADSKLFGGVMAFAVGIGFLWAGLWLSLDKRGRYVHSSKSVLALAVLSLAGALALLGDVAGLKDAQVVFAAGLVLVPGVCFLAYRFRNTFLLILALLAFFHWVGSWNEMWGRSTYALEIQDPRWMSGAALAVIGLGVVHERLWQARTLRFYQAYQVLGLIYLNLSLLILPIEREEARMVWILVWAVAGLLQLVAGGWLKNSIFMGFGVTVLGVNLFTRYSERFWDDFAAGTFFLLGGVGLFGFGVLCELLLRRMTRAGTA